MGRGVRGADSVDELVNFILQENDFGSPRDFKARAGGEGSEQTPEGLGFYIW